MHLFACLSTPSDVELTILSFDAITSSQEKLRIRGICLRNNCTPVYVAITLENNVEF